MMLTILKGEVICDYCGTYFHYDEGRRCWECDGLVCEECIGNSPEPLCPECTGRGELTESFPPMLAVLGDMPREQAEWGFEYKWDGIRAITYWDGKRLRIESRNLIDITHRYPELHRISAIMEEKSVILDGEIVALDKKGRPDFPLLQKRMHLEKQNVERVAKEVRVWYYIFDVLHSEGVSRMKEPYRKRRELLENLGLDSERLRVPPQIEGEGDRVLETAKQHGLEGILCKKLDSFYEPGKRTSNWRKVKIVPGQEFVIGGWITEKNDPGRIGSILVGYYGLGLGLIYAGSVGTGFNEQIQKILYQDLKKIELGANPFATGVPKKEVRFVRPVLVAEVEYRRWPEGGFLQQASFKGLKTDKSPSEVTDERKE